MSYSPPPPPPPGGASPYGQPMAVGTNKKAIWSLVTSILGLLCCGFLSIAAVVLGNMAKKEISQTGQQGGGMATAGLVIGIIGLVWLVISIILIATGNYYVHFSSNS